MLEKVISMLSHIRAFDDDGFLIDPQKHGFKPVEESAEWADAASNRDREVEEAAEKLGTSERTRFHIQNLADSTTCISFDYGRIAGYRAGYADALQMVGGMLRVMLTDD